MPIATLPPGPKSPPVLQTAELTARPVQFVERCRARFGGTFRANLSRIGEMIFFSDPPSIKQVFGSDRDNTITQGRNVVLEPILGTKSLLVQEGEEHLARRRLMLPPFHGERMRAYESTIERAASQEIATWSSGETVLSHPAMQRITLEVIMDAVFGVADERHDELRAGLNRVLRSTRSPSAFGLTFPLLRKVPPYSSMLRSLRETDQLIAAEIAERRAAGPATEEREDILSMLVAARDENGNGLDDVELRDQLMTLLLAGHETTATALAWCMDLLPRDPAAYERLRSEIDATGGGEWMEAVIAETLRVRPVVPMIGRELRKPMELDGWSLSPGTSVMLSIYLAHTRPDVFPDPYRFDPGRFDGVKPDTYSWIPFGGGTRRCIGAAFAQFEMKVVLRTVLSALDLAPGSDRPDEMVRRNVTLSPKHGSPVLVTGRRS